MANNYLSFSGVLTKLTPEEEAWLREQLEWIESEGAEENGTEEPGAEEAPWSGPRFLQGYPEYDPECGERGFEYEFHDAEHPPEGWGRHLWLFSEECGAPGHVAWLVQKFLQAFRPQECWALTYAMTCSKMRAGEFAGGAVFVTAEEISWMDTYQFVEERHQAFLEGRQEPIATLIAQVRSGGASEENLDALVHELAASEAAGINNGGLARQVQYLVEQVGLEEATRMLVPGKEAST